jgi:hypothetical protein
MRDYPRGVKRLIRQHAAAAYEVELARELAALDRHCLIQSLRQQILGWRPSSNLNPEPARCHDELVV